MRRLLIAACAGLLLGPAAAQNLANGRDIHMICAGCHGKFAQGGKDGLYPRLAGQRALYIEEQLMSFRSRKRLNIPMLPYTQERELPDADIADVAAYLSSIVLTTRPPVFKNAADAVRRREDLDKVFTVERVEGDLKQGRGIYNAECGGCHGRNGRGRSNFPMLVGQYTNYLQRQMDAYRRAERPHDDDLPGKGVLMKLTAEDMTNVLAFLTSVQEAED